MMKSLRSTIDVGQLNAVTDQVLSYSPPPKKGKKEKRAEGSVKNPLSTKKGAGISKLKKS